MGVIGTGAVVDKAVQETKEIHTQVEEKKKSEAEIALAYGKASLALEDVKVKPYDDVMYGRAIKVAGKIKNNGDKEIHSVKLLVKFKDSTGAYIGRTLL